MPTSFKWFSFHVCESKSSTQSGFSCEPTIPLRSPSCLLHRRWVGYREFKGVRSLHRVQRRTIKSSPLCFERIQPAPSAAWKSPHRCSSAVYCGGNTDSRRLHAESFHPIPMFRVSFFILNTSDAGSLINDTNNSLVVVPYLKCCIFSYLASLNGQWWCLCLCGSVIKWTLV